MYSSKEGYIVLRRLMLSFQSSGIALIMRYAVRGFIARAQAPDDSLKDLVDLIYSCLSFNYNISYYEFETDC